jgi:uncharacterized membrane protein YciS (DUF1049 family)
MIKEDFKEALFVSSGMLAVLWAAGYALSWTIVNL